MKWSNSPRYFATRLPERTQIEIARANSNTNYYNNAKNKKTEWFPINGDNNSDNEIV